MGTSTNGQISFGIVFEEGFEFPWDADPWDGDIEAWWRDKNGYVPIESPFDDRGRYKRGFDDKHPQVEKYFDHQIAWDKEHPVPVSMDNYCSGDCPMWMLATPGLGTSNRRGYPEEITPALFVDTTQAAADLIAFCEKWEIDRTQCETGEGQPKWWLSSYWG